MAAKEVIGGGGGFGGAVAQGHAGPRVGTATIAEVASGAGGHQIIPAMLAAPVARDDVVNGEV